MNAAREGTSRLRHALDWAAVGLFAAFLTTPPLVQGLSGTRVEAKELEARQPEPAPRIPAGPGEIRRFARGFDGWYADRFGMRGALLRAGAAASWFAGGSPSPLLARGRGEWVFWDGEGALDGWRGVDPLPVETLEAWRLLLEDRQVFLAERGVLYLFVLVPSKPHVYPEHLPRGVVRHGPSRLEQVLEELAASGVDVLDLRPALLEAKAEDAGEDRTFYRLGMHWTSRGAHAAAEAIVARLEPLLPDLVPAPRAGYELKPFPEHGDSWARKMGIHRWVPQAMFTFEPARGWSTELHWQGHRRETWRTERRRPRGVLLHDSFGMALARRLAESFGELHCIDGYDLDPARLVQPVPDAVIQLVSEQGLSRFSPFFTPFGGRPASGYPLELEERFASSSEVLAKVDVHVNRPAVSPVGAARVQAGREWAGGGLRVVRNGGDAAMLLPAHRSWGGGAILRLRFVAEHDTALDLLSAAGGRLRYDARRSRRIAVHQGANDVLIELEPELVDGHARILIRPGLRGSQFVFQEIELRGVE